MSRKTMRASHREICAVIVSYNPDSEILFKLIKQINNQVGAIIIIDNFSTFNVQEKLNQAELMTGNIFFDLLNENKGVAAALNRGIDWAEKHGFEYVLCLDQDSLPAENMVVELYNVYRKLNEVEKVAAVGPRLIDDDTSAEIPFIKFSSLGLKKKYNKKNPVVSFLLTSGTFLKIEIFKKIGKFDESLFIDYIDVDWGFKAASCGYKCFGIPSAILKHRVGDYIIKFPFGIFPHYAPFRLYYIFRNALLLRHKKYIPLFIRLRFILSLFPKIIIYSCINKPRLESFKMMLLGMFKIKIK